MNTSHYPSLPLCKKLTGIGFPKTEKSYSKSLNWDEKNETYPYEILLRPTPWGYYICPSIAEMLDVIPKDIKWCWCTIIKNYSWWFVRFEWEYLPMWMAWDRWQCESLPNALAEMILWLVEEKYLSFNQ